MWTALSVRTARVVSRMAPKTSMSTVNGPSLPCPSLHPLCTPEPWKIGHRIEAPLEARNRDQRTFLWPVLTPLGRKAVTQHVQAAPRFCSNWELRSCLTHARDSLADHVSVTSMWLRILLEL